MTTSATPLIPVRSGSIAAHDANSENALAAFQWAPQPQAERLLKEIVEEFLVRCAFASALARRMREETGTRFFDWIDHIDLPNSEQSRHRLTGAGFVRKPLAGAPERFVHEGGMFPAVVLRDEPATRVAIKVESAADFAAVWSIPPDVAIEGEPLAAVRRVRASSESDAELWAIERHGSRSMAILSGSPPPGAALRYQETFRRRARTFDAPGAEGTGSEGAGSEGAVNGGAFDGAAQGFTSLGRLIDAAIIDLGVGYTTDLFFAAEREFWQRRNRAAQVQKARQDKLGLGWANHDHHTYRSSRRCFAPLIALFERMGFVCRERFYAGADAGWGAQVLEQPEAGVVIFADVDLSPEELTSDFSHEGLADRKELGTVGLWCALHGEAIFEAGMHHLECQFDFDALKDQLEAEEEVKVMKPFTNFPYLRQAFTEGEVWAVDERRIAKLLAAGGITERQAQQFRQTGAIGSHLENLERNEGFKGFNQKGVSDIIARTDPRHADPGGNG